jgi:tRNA A-37 threonylcarbamoyl transferase component Bud32
VSDDEAVDRARDPERAERGLRFKRVMARGEASDGVRRLLEEPDRAFDDGLWLKRGNACSVVKVSVDGRPLVLKRYNLKSRWREIKMLVKPSRAARSWFQGHRLMRLGIETPKPVAYAEERIGPFRRRAFLVNEFCDGVHSDDFFAQRPPDWEPRLRAFAATLRRMWDHGIIHRDLKPENILVTDERFVLTDLDSMIGLPRAISGYWRNRDMEHLLRRLEPFPDVRAILREELAP